MTKKTNSHEESLLCPQLGLSSSSEDNTPFLSTSFPLRNVSSSGGSPGQWWRNTVGTKGAAADRFACSCLPFPQPQKPIKWALIENDNRCPTPGACVWARPCPLCLPGIYLLPPHCVACWNWEYRGRRAVGEACSYV